MLRRLSILFFLFLSSYHIVAQNNDTIQSRVIKRLIPINNFINDPFDNPALYYYRFASTLSSFSLDGIHNYQKEVVVHENGKGGKSCSIHANSFLVLGSNTRLWGDAVYDNGKKENVAGNETSDYSLIYPYVTADSIGGDMNSETYAFSGGYAHEYKKITYGAEFYYRSLIEYRKIDPRPRNIVADLNIKIGLAYDINKSYKGAFAFGYKRYKQSGDISYYNPLGFSNILHLSGLGMDYSRFSGKETAYLYKGNEVSMQLSLFPISISGISATIEYSNFIYTKELTLLNKLPLNELNNNKIKAEITLKREVNDNNIIGVKAVVHYKQKDGTENIFGSSTNAYVQISKAQHFYSQEIQAQLDGLYQTKLTDKILLFANASLNWNKKEYKYKMPNRDWENSYVGYGVTLGSVMAKKYNTFFMKIDLNRQHNIDNNLSLSQSQSPNYFERLIQSNNIWLASNVWQLGISAYVDFKFKKLKDKVLFIEETLNYNIYESKSMHTNIINISLGIKL